MRSSGSRTRRARRPRGSGPCRRRGPTSRLVLAHEVDVGHLADGQDLGQRLVLAARRERGLELGRPVEVVLHQVFLDRPVTMRMSSMPAATASSTTYWIPGLSTRGIISLGVAFVAGRKRVPRPAAGMTALRTRMGATVRTPRGVATAGPAGAPAGGEWARTGAPAAGRAATDGDLLETAGRTWCREPGPASIGTRKPRVLTERAMPTYVYKFLDTGETIEVQQSFHEPTLTEAPHPSDGVPRPVKKVFTPVGITFKGNGFYKTDSRGSKNGSSASSSNGSSSNSDTSSSSSSSDSSGSSSRPARRAPRVRPRPPRTRRPASSSSSS